MRTEEEFIASYCAQIVDMSLIDESTDLDNYRLQSERLGAIAAFTLMAILEGDHHGLCSHPSFEPPVEAQAA